MLDTTSKNNKTSVNSYINDNESCIDHGKVVSELKTSLESYIENKSNVSVNGFCTQNNLSPSTVWNLLKGITEKSISAEIARKIVFGMNRGKRVGDILKSLRGNLGKFLRERYSSMILSDMESTPVESISFDTKNARIIAVLAHNEGGTTRKEIEETLDKFALSDLKRMLKEGFLVEDENGIITGKKENLAIDNETTKKLIKDVTYFSKFPETSDSQIKFLCHKLTPEQVKRQKVIIDEAIVKLRKLHKESHPSSKKKVHSYVTLMADTLKQPDIDGGLQ